MLTNRHTQNQAGISLMLAVLILAAITSIAFSLATIVLIQIKTAGDSARTEPNLYATLGVTEEALFQYKRYYNNTALFDVPTCQPASVCLINHVGLSTFGPVQFDASPRVEFLPKGTTKTFAMYIPNTDSSFDKVYQSMTIEVLENSSHSDVQYYLYGSNYNGDPSCPVADFIPSTTDCDYANVSPGASPTFTQFAPQTQYLLVINNPSSTQDLQVKITTSRVEPLPEPQGLPFVGEQVLKVIANYLGLTRVYQVRIPTQ